MESLLAYFMRILNYCVV